MEGLPQTSHGGHKTESMKPLSGEGSDVLKESRIRFYEDLLVQDDILQDLSFLINDELQALGRILKIPEGSLPKIHTDYGAQQRETTYKMLVDWKKEMGNKATYGVLVEALVAAGREDLAYITTDLILVDEHQLKRWKVQIERKLLDLEEETLITEGKPFQSESHEEEMLMKGRKPFQPEFHEIRHLTRRQLHLERQRLDLEQEMLIEGRNPFQPKSHEIRHLTRRQLHLERQRLDLEEEMLIEGRKPFQPELHGKEIRKLRIERKLLDLEEEILVTEGKLSVSECRGKEIRKLRIERKLLDLEEEILVTEGKLSVSESRGKEIWKLRIRRKFFDLEEEILVTEGKLSVSESREKKHQLNIMRNVQRPIDRKLLDLIRKNLMKKERKRFQSGLHEEYHDLKIMKVRTERQSLELEQEKLRWESHSFGLHLYEHNLKERKLRIEVKLLDKEEEILMIMAGKPLYSESHDKLGHFVRCLKARYTTWLWLLKRTPWMKSGKLHIDDMFVDVDLMLRNPSERTTSGADWQPLNGFEALFSHPVLQTAHVINIEGESGSGKTFLLHRMMLSWCQNESFTQNVKLFILLPSSCITGRSIHESLDMIIKNVLLPRNSFLTPQDLREILMNTKSVLVLDDISPDNKSLGTMSSIKDFDKLVFTGKLQFICPTSGTTEDDYGGKFLSMTVRLQKWQKTQQLSYLQKFLPNETMYEQILKLLSENSALVDLCGNPLCYALFIYSLKGDLICGKDETIQNLTRLFQRTFERLAKPTGTKQLEGDDESEFSLYREDIILAAYEHLGSSEWQINVDKVNKSFQIMVDVGILEKVTSYRNPLHYTNSVRFCHSTFQIWFAALYLSECPNFRSEYEQIFFSKHQSRWSTPLTITDKALLQRFICGLNSERSVILMEDLAKGRYSDEYDDEHFFLCLNEYCGTDDPLRPVINAICQRKIEFKLGGSNQLVQKSIVKVLKLASQWKIIIKCIDMSNHEIVDVDENSLTLDNGVHLGIVSAKLLRIHNWRGKELENYLNKCLNLEETRIFANDPRKRRHEIQKEVKGMDFKVRWESNYNYEDNGTETEEDKTMNLAVLFEDTEEEDEIVNLAHLFESVDIVSEIQPVLSEILSKEMYVDARGGRLVIEEADLMLDIPAGALSEGMNIRVAVVNDNGVMFPGDDTPMVTPIVKCKPTGLTFQTPVTLVLPHCGILTPNKDHRAISMQGYTSDGCLQWNIDENSQTTISQSRCSIKLSHFCYRSSSITGLQYKRMRVFILKKKTECAVLVKLWICNDNQSVFNNIVNDEQDDGYQKMGSHEEFALSIKKGDIQIKCSGIDVMISLEDIWNVSRRSTFFQIPMETNIGVILLVKQIEQDEAYSLRFFIDEKTPCKRRKRKHPSRDSSNEQQCLLISESRNSKSSSSENVITTPGRNEVKDFKEKNLVSRSSLENLSGLVGKKWLELGRRLDLHDEKLQNISRDHAGNEKETIYQMLLIWHSKNGQHATYHHLFAALRAVDRKDLIEDSTLSEKWVNT